MTPANIKAGFRATGIHPFQPDMIPDTAYALSTVTLIPINEEVSDSCVEPLPSSSLCLTINCLLYTSINNF